MDHEADPDTGRADAICAFLPAHHPAQPACIVYLLHSHRELLFQKKDCQLVPDRLRETLHFGSVTALHQSGLYIGKMLVQGAVNTGGTDLIAAYTAATRVEGFANSFGDSGSAAISHCA